MTIKIEPAGGRSAKVVVIVDGKAPEKVDPKSGRDQRAACKKLGIADTDLMSALAAYEAQRQATSSGPIHQPFSVESWNEGQPAIRTDRVGFESQWTTLQRALDTRAEHHRWGGKSQLCVLDVDVRRGMDPFTGPEAEALVTSCVGPLPAAWWISRSGGIHFVFVADSAGTGSGLTAEQKAGAFALLCRGLRRARVVRLELLAHTRRPPEAPYVGVRRFGVADLRGRLAGTGGTDAVTPEEVSDWLVSRGLSLGGRFPHEQCPFDPGPSSSSRDPVVIHDGGVTCFRCASANSRGTASWASLLKTGNVDEAEQDPVTRAAIERVHWTHAEVLLAAYSPQLLPPLRRAAYSALATIFHDADVATSMQLWGSRPALLRSEAGWIDWPSGQLMPIGPSSTRTLPWARSPEGVEVAGRSPNARLDGYVPIRPSRCLVDAPTDYCGIVVAPVTDASDAPLKGDVPEPDRALAELRGIMPGLRLEHLNALRVLLVAGMRAALAPATPSFLLVDGPSGSGKGFLTALAAGVLGQRIPALIRPNQEATDVARLFGEAVVAGASILHLDEVGKFESMWQASGPLLVLNGWVSWHQMYVGPTTVPLTAAVVLTGSTLPRGLTTMSEFGRRMARCSLPYVRPVDYESWETRFVDHFGTTAEKIMTTEKGRAWAESLRRWARGQCVETRPWLEHACDLGAQRLREDVDATEQRFVVRALYRLWIEAPDTELVAEGRRYRGWLRGWSEGGEPSRVWDVLHEWWPIENDSAERSARERAAMIGRLETADAEEATGLPVRIMVGRHGSRLAIRFRSATKSSGDRRDREAFPLLPGPGLDAKPGSSGVPV